MHHIKPSQVRPELTVALRGLKLVNFISMASYSICSAVAAVLLLFAPVEVIAQNVTFVCDGSGDSAPYNATKKYLGCYMDSSVSILGEAKLSTIAMTPQYCANWCGGKGYGYGGILFGTSVERRDYFENADLTSY
jgi:hypothetical protein